MNRAANVIQEEIWYVERHGLGRDQMPTAREGQLAAYLAGLRRALRLVKKT